MPNAEHLPNGTARHQTPGGSGAHIVHPRVALALLGAVILVWGVNWPIMKLALDYIPPLTFAVARLVLGGLCLTAVLIARRSFRVPGRQDLGAAVHQRR